MITKRRPGLELLPAHWFASATLPALLSEVAQANIMQGKYWWWWWYSSISPWSWTKLNVGGLKLELCGSKLNILVVWFLVWLQWTPFLIYQFTALTNTQMSTSEGAALPLGRMTQLPRAADFESIERIEKFQFLICYLCEVLLTPGGHGWEEEGKAPLRKQASLPRLMELINWIQQ